LKRISRTGEWRFRAIDLIGPLERLTAALPAGSRRLAVEWHDRWSTTLDDALNSLPEAESCPHDLFRLLAQPRGDLHKRIALVVEADEPVAVIALRRRFDLWESVCDGIVPNAFAAMRPARWDAAAALGRLVKVNEWAGAPPALAADREIKPRYRVSTSVDFDALWKRQHNAESVARARNRCAREGGFALEVDGDGAAEWIIENWRDRWAGDRFGEAQIAADAVEVARFLRDRGRCHAFRLLHNERPVAGMTMFVSGAVLHFMHSSRDEAYERFGVGTHLFELFFRWAAESPYRVVDLGAGAYKERWAPRDGELTSFFLGPAHLRLAFRMIDRARSFTRPLREDART
jgi:hypothetical protein